MAVGNQRKVLPPAEDPLHITDGSVDDNPHPLFKNRRLDEEDCERNHNGTSESVYL